MSAAPSQPLIAPRQELVVVVPGVPVAKGRARKAEGWHYTPGTTRNWERVAAATLRKAAAGLQFPGRVQLTVVAVFPRPLDQPELVDDGEWLRGGRAFACSTKDLDNVVKAVQDAGNRAGIWSDDRRVVRLQDCESVYAAVGEAPCVEVLVSGRLPAPRPALQPVQLSRPPLRDVGALL